MAALAENTPESLISLIDGQFKKASLEQISPRLLKNFALDVLVKIKFCLKKFAPEEDVYKRQGLTQGQAVEAVVKGVKKGCLETGIYAGVLPVSYTHLDVYKRQKYNSVPNSERKGLSWLFM